MADNSTVRYCQTCGAKLDMTTKRIPPMFESHTGKEVFNYYHYWKCPNRKWWHFLAYMEHHDEFSDEPFPYDP